MGMFLYRVMGAATLDAGMYEGIEADKSTTRQAFAVVVLSSIAAGIGTAGRHGLDAVSVLTHAALALVAWWGWAVLILRVGGRHLPERGTRVTLGELLRTIGFAAAPGWLQVFAVFPSIHVFVYGITWIWMFAAMVVAVKHALDYRHTLRALLVCAFSLGLIVAFVALLGTLFGPAVA